MANSTTPGVLSLHWQGTLLTRTHARLAWGVNDPRRIPRLCTPAGRTRPGCTGLPRRCRRPACPGGIRHGADAGPGSSRRTGTADGDARHRAGVHAGRSGGHGSRSPRNEGAQVQGPGRGHHPEDHQLREGRGPTGQNTLVGNDHPWCAAFVNWWPDEGRGGADRQRGLCRTTSPPRAARARVSTKSRAPKVAKGGAKGSADGAQPIVSSRLDEPVFGADRDGHQRQWATATTFGFCLLRRARHPNGRRAGWAANQGSTICFFQGQRPVGAGQGPEETICCSSSRRRTSGRPKAAAAIGATTRPTP